MSKGVLTKHDEERVLDIFYQTISSYGYGKMNSTDLDRVDYRILATPLKEVLANSREWKAWVKTPQFKSLAPDVVINDLKARKRIITAAKKPFVLDLAVFYRESAGNFANRVRRVSQQMAAASTDLEVLTKIVHRALYSESLFLFKKNSSSLFDDYEPVLTTGAVGKIIENALKTFRVRAFKKADILNALEEIDKVVPFQSLKRSGYFLTQITNHENWNTGSAQKLAKEFVEKENQVFREATVDNAFQGELTINPDMKFATELLDLIMEEGDDDLSVEDVEDYAIEVKKEVFKKTKENVEIILASPDVFNL